jgi:hypothetical protein
MTASPHPPDDRPLSPAESLALIDAQGHEAHRRLRPNPLGLYLPWGLAYLIAFGAVWLTVGPGVLPAAVTAVLVALSAVGAVATVVTTVARSHRGVAGPTRTTSTRFVWAWFVAFLVLGVTNGALADLGLPVSTVSLIWSGSALLVVGLLLLAGGMLWPGSGQYPLGVWILVSSALSVLVGYPANFLVLALAGGGGLVVMAVVVHVRGRSRG